jgi:transketolase
MLQKQAAMRDAYGEALIELGASNPKVVVLGADTTGSVKSGVFGVKYPERFFNLGIAEQNLIGVAAGFALAGKIPYAGTYAIFVPGKCVDQIRNNVCYPNLNVKIVCSHGGISVGPDGASHQQVEDIAIMRVIPRMHVEVPGDSVSARGIITSIADIPGPFYVRLARPSSPVVYEGGFEYQMGKANALEDGGDVAIMAAGLMLPEALKASELLRAKGMSATVLDLHSVKPMDEDAIEKAARRCGAVVTAEEHNIMGGVGSAVAEVLTDRYPVPVKRIGMRDSFGESGDAGELLTKYGLTSDAIAAAAISLKSSTRD